MWQERAVCRLDPDMWFTASERTAAVHICRHHCPVFAECRASLPALGLAYGVMGGVPHADNGAPMKKAGLGATVAVCGPYCRAYRKEQ